jgi:hypothetical protein
VLLCGKATEYIFQFSGDLVVWVYFDGTCMPDQIQGRCLPDPWQRYNCVNMNTRPPLWFTVHVKL